MTHYQKLATMLFRIVGVFFLVVAILTAVGGYALSMFWIREAGFLIAITYALPCTIIGILFCSLGRRLSMWVCFDFDRWGGPPERNSTDGLGDV